MKIEYKGAHKTNFICLGDLNAGDVFRVPGVSGVFVAMMTKRIMRRDGSKLLTGQLAGNFLPEDYTCWNVEDGSPQKMPRATAVVPISATLIIDGDA